MPLITARYYQLLGFISWISASFLKVFIFFASPAKGCHSTLDYSSKQARWSTKTARLPPQPPTPSWRGARLAYLEKGREDVVPLSTARVGFISPLWQTTAGGDTTCPAGIAKVLPKGK